MATHTVHSEATYASRAWKWVKEHWRGIEYILPVLFVVFIVDWLTFAAGFGGNDDPGTYISQAYAVLDRGQLAHYTYWYDHPPFGWIQMALYAWVTRGFERGEISTLMASEFMVIAQLVSCVLIFALMRRLRFHRAFASFGAALFALSPLAVQYQKMSFLDNLSVVWLLGAMVFAASPRRSVGAAFGAGICLAFSVVTKETAALWFVVVGYMLWQRYAKHYRAWPLTVYVTSFITLSASYLLYATLKGELFPGPGHVSLVGSLAWQLNRDKASNTLDLWLSFDRYLLYATLAALPFALCVRRLRPIALGFVIMALMVVRGGYIPSPMVIGILPFAALTVAGTIAALWPHREVGLGKLRQWANGRSLRIVRMVMAVAVIIGMVAFVSPKWTESVKLAMPRGEVVYYEQAMAWVEENVPKDAVIAVDDNMWIDLTRRGYTNVEWFYKLDLDPAIKEKRVPDGVGYKGIDYVVLKNFYFSIAKDNASNSIVLQAQQHSDLVAQFGNTERSRGPIVEPYVVYKVQKTQKGSSQ